MRVHWFKQVMSLVHPRFWEERHGAPADELVAAAHLDDRWGENLVESWTKAAWLHSSAEWAMSLWDGWRQKQRGEAEWSTYTSLLTTMPQPEAERRILNVLSDPEHPGRKDWVQALDFLPRPWSKTFGEAYLGQLQAYTSTLKFEKQGSPYHDPWYQSLATAATALPAVCFAQAVERFVIPDTSDTKAQWQQALKEFVETMRTRQRLVKEIVL